MGPFCEAEAKGKRVFVLVFFFALKLDPHFKTAVSGRAAVRLDFKLS